MAKRPKIKRTKEASRFQGYSKPELQVAIDALQEQNRSFGLALSALTAKEGKFDEVTGKYEYPLHLEDFERISEANLDIENEMVDGVPTTWLRVRPKEENG